MQLNKPWMKWAAAANIFAAACALYAADPAIITIASKNLFPESITSTADGAIIIGSFGTSTIWRIPRGENNASQWIDASKNKGPLLGVLADEKPADCWSARPASRPSTLKPAPPRKS